MADIDFASEHGIVRKNHTFDELFELHDIVEQSPHWDTIEKITITKSKIIPRLTLETAEELGNTLVDFDRLDIETIVRAREARIKWALGNLPLSDFFISERNKQNDSDTSRTK